MMWLHHSTLYCAKGNYEFGISRVIKSLEPYSRKVHAVLQCKLKCCDCYADLFCSLVLIHGSILRGVLFH